MACSSNKAWWLLGWICAVGAAAAAPPAAAPAPATGPAASSAPATTPAATPAATSAAAPAPVTPASQLPIVVDAASSDVDYKTHTYTFEKVTISQGTMRVQADRAHATGLDFANSHWTFDGHVHIMAEEHGNLSADQAVVEFTDNHIARATVNGQPAEFEQQRADSQQQARGHADQIVYDVSDGSVRLSSNAWLADGQNEISGPLLVYNIRLQRVQAATTAGSGERVHITIVPQSLPDVRGKGEPPKPPPKPQS
jgi:lipopolysaccharide export system protein LptA